MCTRINVKEHNKRKVVIAYKVFVTYGHDDQPGTGLYPLVHRPQRMKSAPTKKWIRSTRIGWHAYLLKRDANYEARTNRVVKKVKLRKVIGYSRVWSGATGSNLYAVRALEMYIC